MLKKINPSLSELLYCVANYIDKGTESFFADEGIDCKLKYFPVLKAMDSGALTITEITEKCYITQGAVSQAVKAMEDDGIIEKISLEDGRKSGVKLTKKGKRLQNKLNKHLNSTNLIIKSLEEEIGASLFQSLYDAASSLQKKSFYERMKESKN